MECIIAYLLLTLFIDLALEIARMDCTADEAEWIKRSLWGQAPFDCGSRAVSAMATVPQQHIEARRNRFRVVRGRGVAGRQSAVRWEPTPVVSLYVGGGKALLKPLRPQKPVMNHPGQQVPAALTVWSLDLNRA